MNDPIIDIPEDSALEAINKVNASGQRIGAVLSEELTRVILDTRDILPAFFAHPLVGNKGVALLQTLVAHVTLLATHYPHLMNEVLAAAGKDLIPHEDGTVTYEPEKI